MKSTKSFHKDSYGYRPYKSAHQALEITRKRCWKYDWVLEFDIKGLFDNIDHELLMKAVKKHTDNRWQIYAPFTLDEISDKIAELLTPPDTQWKGSLKVIYQSLEGLHNAIENFTGDWYFGGNYPTVGGIKVVNNSYIKWYHQDDSRSY